MKTLKWSLLLMLITGVGVLTVMFLTRSPRPLDMDANEATDANEPTQAADRNEAVVYQSTPAATVPVRELPATIPLAPDKTDMPAADIASESANVMQVRADQVLAKVNNQAILLADLVPLRPDEQEQAMTSEEYQSRLNRAIEMELTFQAAAAGEVDLTPEQKRRVDVIARRHVATLQKHRKEGVAWSSVTPAQVEFEQRLASALMLQQNYVAREAHLAPDSDANVQLGYDHARNEVLSRLKAQGNISVSTAEL
jgi:hypothetical protein